MSLTAPKTARRTTARTECQPEFPAAFLACADEVIERTATSAFGHFGHGAMSDLSPLCGRLCCKTRKMPWDQFPGNRPNKPQSPNDVASGPLPKSPASSPLDNVVPQMIIRSPRVRPGKPVFSDAKRLLQQYLPLPDSCGAAAPHAAHKPSCMSDCFIQLQSSGPASLSPFPSWRHHQYLRI